MQSIKNGKKIDYNLIKVFDMVITEGNASRAAQKLEVTPAAVSQALLRLQKLYGEELFIRTRKGLIPSRKGKSLHLVFRQAIESIDSTLYDKTHDKESNELIILGGDMVENYYFPALEHSKLFSQYIIKHYAIKRTGKHSPASMLTHGYVDAIVGITEIEDDMIEPYPVDNLYDFICICGKNSPLIGLEKISLYNFYAARHAVYHSDMFSSCMSETIPVYKSSAPYTGYRKIGYYSDSLPGIIGVVEQSDMIAVLPRKIAAYFKEVRNYNIKIMKLPDEIFFRPLPVYAYLSVKSTHYENAKSLVSTLQSAFLFRQQKQADHRVNDGASLCRL
ncbi:LysR family transcriptional regulator [Salmonella enterica subsp. salamae]|nr:LysR family transcriptional regulator [Salmonella enterica subsp. salamae]ECJ2279751.1 LysR family transcriptional regulator [Salmonella enterica subsp. salamae]HCC0887425.1 LysR family transcriptional regulator [Salmonella enterica]